MATDYLNEKMLTVSEVSTILHVHPNTLRRWADKGVIKSFCITPRGDRRFLSRDIDQFLAEMKVRDRSLTLRTHISKSLLETDDFQKDSL
jgi:excisionase family DNA binding protein